MAYTKDLNVLCDAGGCVKVATVEVFNDRNTSLGRYCKRDAQSVVTRLERREDIKRRAALGPGPADAK